MSLFVVISYWYLFAFLKGFIVKKVLGLALFGFFVFSHLFAIQEVIKLDSSVFGFIKEYPEVKAYEIAKEIVHGAKTAEKFDQDEYMRYCCEFIMHFDVALNFNFDSQICEVWDYGSLQVLSFSFKYYAEVLNSYESESYFDSKQAIELITMNQSIRAFYGLVRKIAIEKIKDPASKPYEFSVDEALTCKYDVVGLSDDDFTVACLFVQSCIAKAIINYIGDDGK
jgi:hypothetical protein